MVIISESDELRNALSFLKGCHNCTWYNNVCSIGVEYCEWENDGSYAGVDTSNTTKTKEDEE